MKNEENLGNRRFSNKEPHLPFLCRLRRRAKIFRNLGIFEKTPIDESLNPPVGTPAPPAGGTSPPRPELPSPKRLPPPIS